MIWGIKKYILPWPNPWETMTTVPGIPNLRLNNNAPQRALAAMASLRGGETLLKKPKQHWCMCAFGDSTMFCPFS